MAARRGNITVLFVFTVMVVSYIIMTRFVLGNLFWSGSSPESRQNLDADSDLSLTAPSRPTRHPSRKYGIGGSLPAKKLLYAIRATKAPKPVETVTVEVPETPSNITIEIVNFPTFFPIPQTKARNSMKFHIPNSKSQPEFFDEDDYDPKHPYKPTSAFDLSEQNVNNYFEYYYSLHREILDNKRPKRILCFKPNASGLGNKLLGFYTSFLLAMMTDRAFAICDWPTFYDYFEMKIPVPHFKERQLRNATKLVYGPSCGPKPEYKTESFEKLFPSDIIIYQTNCPALDYFVKNPNCIERLRKIGFWPKRGKTQSYTKLKIETYMAHYVMRPTKVIRDIIMAEINKRSRDSIYTGLHIRTGNQTDFFVKNAKPFLSDNDIEYMVHTALKKSKSLGSRNKWFVSSDSTLVKTRIQSRNPDLVDTYNAQVLHSGGGAFRPKHQGVYDAIVEMYLLGASDDIFGTRGSTYSYIASLIARRDLTLIGLNDGPKHGFK